MRKSPLFMLLLLSGICIVAVISLSAMRWTHLQSDIVHTSTHIRTG